MVRLALRLAVILVAALPGCRGETTEPMGTPSTVTIAVYVDADGSGSLSARDVPVAGETVRLRAEADGDSLEAVTAADGVAAFHDVPPGRYRAEFAGTTPAYAVLASATTPAVIAPFDGGDIVVEIRFVYDYCERRITFSSFDGYVPSISGDRVVWVDNRNGNPDIYLYDLATGIERQITTDTARQGAPRISGDLIVWEDWRNTPSYPFSDYVDIYLYDLATGTERPIATGPWYKDAPDVDAGRIVWEDDRNYAEASGDIYLYDLATETERRITTSPYCDRDPSIDGHRVVWQNGCPNAGADVGFVHLYDLATDTERQISNEQGYWPRISGDHIVWDVGLSGVHMFDLAAGSERLIAPAAHPRLPDVDGDRIVWDDDRNGNHDIYLYDLATETEHQITTDSVHQRSPRISENRIVWVDNRHGTADVFVYDLAVCGVP